TLTAHFDTDPVITAGAGAGGSIDPNGSTEAARPRLVCWLPVMDEVRTRIESYFGDFCFAIPCLYQHP
ncbi:MAG: hypothetical protein PHP28_03560, partial [Actinomycetota bacterium]|nr:hypothetical protein [Actinomycetota bacterium]